jgi:hypothetical protein
MSCSKGSWDMTQFKYQRRLFLLVLKHFRQKQVMEGWKKEKNEVLRFAFGSPRLPSLHLVSFSHNDPLACTGL